MTLGFDHLGALRTALANLRASWPQGWPGLGAVVEGCLHWITPGPNPVEAPARLLQAVRATAFIVEQDGAAWAAQGREPRYHNRLHIADTLVSLACLMRVHRDLSQASGRFGGATVALQPTELIGLLAMLIHDFRHDGSINEEPGELEGRSLQLFLPHAQSLDLTLDEWHLLTRLVINTDPSGVGSLHEEYRTLAEAEPGIGPGALTFRELAVLITEADVLASVFPETGEQLSRSLVQEWACRYPDRAARLTTPEGRLGFLTFGARFSSQAARHLRIPEVVQQQVGALTRQIQSNRQPATGQRSGQAG